MNMPHIRFLMAYTGTLMGPVPNLKKLGMTYQECKINEKQFEHNLVRS